MSALRIEYIGGNCPVQAEGSVGGAPFYFRARGQHWSIGIGDDPVAVSMGLAPGFSRYEPWGDDKYAAGWMSIEEARAIIERCAAEYVAEAE